LFFGGIVWTVSADELIISREERFVHVDHMSRAEDIIFIGGLGQVAAKSSGSILAIATTLAVSAGDDIIVALATDPNANMVVNVTDSAGNDYEQVSLIVNSGQIRTYLFVALNATEMPSGSTITIDKGVEVTARVAAAALFSGLADNGSLEQTASATGTSTALSSGTTSTTNQPNELLIGEVGTEDPVGDIAGTWDGSYSDISRTGTSGDADDSNITIALGYRIVSSTSAYTASKSGITSRDWGAIITTFGQTTIIGNIDFNILLGRPTDDSMTFNVILNADIDFKVKYGVESGDYPYETEIYSGEEDVPSEFVIDGLSANTRYYYHIAYQEPGATTWQNDDKHSFITKGHRVNLLPLPSSATPI